MARWRTGGVSERTEGEDRVDWGSTGKARGGWGCLGEDGGGWQWEVGWRWPGRRGVAARCRGDWGLTGIPGAERIMI